MTLPSELPDICAQFAMTGRIRAIEPFHGGHIHRSYCVTSQEDTARRRWLLQGINTQIFTDPDAVMSNIRRVTDHLRASCPSTEMADLDRRVLTIVPTRDGQLFHRHHDGSAWRVFRFIERVHVRGEVRSADAARCAGQAFGAFLRALTNLAPPRLAEILPRFHDTPWRFESFDRACAADPLGRVRSVLPEISNVLRRRALADVLVGALARGEIPERPTHNDAKPSNVLLDDTTGEALCVVDLDTVMPGSALYDFGDMVRSMTCRAAEDETDLSKVTMERPLFAGLAEGWLRETSSMLTPTERGLLVRAGQVITLEQAVRFLTDHVAGDVYYATARPSQNLDRARVQIRLLESLEQNAEWMESVVAASSS